MVENQIEKRKKHIKSWKGPNLKFSSGKKKKKERKELYKSNPDGDYGDPKDVEAIQ